MLLFLGVQLVKKNNIFFLLVLYPFYSMLFGFFVMVWDIQIQIPRANADSLLK